MKEVRGMKTLEQRVDELEKKVAALEGRVPEQSEAVKVIISEKEKQQPKIWVHTIMNGCLAK